MRFRSFELCILIFMCTATTFNRKRGSFIRNKWLAHLQLRKNGHSGVSAVIFSLLTRNPIVIAISVTQNKAHQQELSSRSLLFGLKQNGVNRLISRYEKLGIVAKLFSQPDRCPVEGFEK